MSELKIQKSDGISFIEREGSGPSVVFLHGIGSNAGSFRSVFDHLPSSCHLLAWNAPGYGDSDPLRPDWPTATAYAEALAKFLKARDLGSVILVGHSLGTLIAAAFARTYPDQVSHLILVSCAAGYGVPVGGDMPASVAARISDLETLGPKDFARTRAPRLVHQPAQYPDVVARVEDAMSKVTRSGYAQAVRMLASGSLNDTLRDLQGPCSFITGTEDQVTPPDQTFAAATAWAESRGETPGMERIEQAGHAVYMQQPDAFAKTLQHLIASIEMNGETND